MLEETLKQQFGLDRFRLGQREAVEAVLNGHDAIVVMPTGSGKSLCYQLTALMLDGVTIVISPLIALMKDQVDALTAKGIATTYINSSVSAHEVEQRMADMESGRYKLVYIAPERLANAAFRRRIKATRVSLVAIDEAHCISQWGHDFRTDYLTIGEVLSEMPDVRVLALTATATPEVRDDIQRQLRLGIAPRGIPMVEVLGFARPNLYISVEPCRNFKEKMVKLTEIIHRLRTGIVYVATRKHALELYENLCQGIPSQLGVNILLYHGGMNDDERKKMQQAFMSSQHPVIVATTAFGMGIDRSDIRFVTHWDIPGSVEAYYQEIGRAGRDGRPSDCILLFSYSDVRIQEYFVDGANPDEKTALSVWHALREMGSGDLRFENDIITKRLGLKNGIVVGTVINVLVNEGLMTCLREGMSRVYRINQAAREEDIRRIFAARNEKRMRDRQRLRAMVNFAYYPKCRHKYILDYFGDQSPNRHCGGCNNCGKKQTRANVHPSEPPLVQPPLVRQVAQKPVQTITPQVPVSTPADDINSLLRRYLDIQVAVRKLESERLSLKEKISSIMDAAGEQSKDFVLDGANVHVRCVPKTTYQFDEALLHERLGALFSEVLEPDAKKMRLFKDHVRECLTPILDKVGVPSVERLASAVKDGRITREQLDGTFQRRRDFSFAVSRPVGSHQDKSPC